MKSIVTFILDWTDINPALKLQSRDSSIKRIAATFGKPGQVVEIKGELTKIVPGKSNAQLGYYHAVVLPIGTLAFKEAGYTTITELEVHQHLKDMFLFTAVENEQTGDLIKIVKSMGDCTVEEVSRYITDCIDFIQSVLSFEVPPPTKR